MARAKIISQTDDSIFVSRFKQLFPESATTVMIADILSEDDYVITRQSVGNWLNGTMPHAEQLKRISQTFNVSVDWLLGISDIRTPNTNIRYMCEYTGLSENAVHALHDCKRQHSTIKNPPKTSDILYTENDGVLDVVSLLFETGLIQNLSENLDDLQRYSGEYINSDDLNADNISYYDSLSDKADIAALKIMKTIVKMQNCFDEREKQPEKAKQNKQIRNGILDKSAEFHWNDSKEKGDK